MEYIIYAPHTVHAEDRAVVAVLVVAVVLLSLSSYQRCKSQVPLL